MEDKQKQHLIDMMKSDEDLGLYEEHKQKTTPEEVAEYLGFVKGAKWKIERLCDSEVIQRIRASKSDAEARRIIRTI